MLGVQSATTIDLFFIVWEGAKESAFHRRIATIPTQNSIQLAEIIPKPTTPFLQKNKLYQNDERKEDMRHKMCTLYDQMKKERNQMNPLSMPSLLLQQCSSWLDINHPIEYLQHTIVTISTKDENYHLSLRSSVADGKEASFQEIMSWLCCNKHHYTATKVALNLLGDSETMQEFTGYTKELSTEILGGICIDGSPFKLSNFEGDMWGDSKETMIDLGVLADLTIVCFAQCGLDMANVLGGFLGRNKRYSAFQACLLLGAYSSFTVGQISAAVDDGDNMPLFSHSSLTSYTTLWPIQCLLRLAVARNCMSDVLLLLNYTIPCAMRNISESISDISLDLCKSIISMILASSTQSATTLLNLVYNDTDTFWTSITHDTRLELSLLRVHDRYPLLEEPEIRHWALGLLHRGTGLKTDSSDFALTNNWLQQVCIACFCNVKCDEVALESLCIDADGQENPDGQMFLHFEREELVTLNIINFSEGKLDFDLVIPSLLILEQRCLRWSEKVDVSTQSILNSICAFARKASQGKCIFAFDNESVMKQCATMGNIRAAANLLGGNDGLVLRCANIIVHGDATKVHGAEEYLIRGKQFVDFEHQRVNQTLLSDHHDFDLNVNYHEILWCMQKYVLDTKSYGEVLSMSTCSNADPTFAARVCFRAWLSVCRENHAPVVESGQWLQRWLQQSLIANDSKLFARAAVIRSLLWTEFDEETLGESLGLSSKFLIELSKASPIGIVNLLQ